MRRRSLRAAAMALALIAAALPARASDLASDLGGNFIAAETANEPVVELAPVDMANADVIVGYVAGPSPRVNPFAANEANMISINQLVFEPVVDLDENLKPIPMLADSWTQEGTEWTFHLRSGIQFHNGAQLTAYDVVRSYEMIQQAGEENPYYSRVAAISSMDSTDILDLHVSGKSAGLSVLYAMNFPVVQYETLGEELARGTGPYWYIQYDMDGTLRMEANPLWWKQQPEVRSILFKRFDDASSAIEALQTNKIQMLATGSPHASLSRKLANLMSLDYLSLTYELLIPNIGSGSLLSDVQVRQAVMYAIDRSLVASNAYGDMAVQCEVPIPPNSWLYESQSAIYYYSPERALQLMNDAGWRDMTGNGKLNRMNGIMVEEPNLLLMTYNEGTNSIRENAAEMIASYLNAVGFNVTVSVKSRSDVRQAIRDRECDLALIGVNLSEVPSLSALLGSGGSINYNRYSNDEMDVLLSRIGGSSSEETLKSLYSQVQMALVNRLPIMGLLWRTGTVLATRSLGGLTALRAYDTFNGFEFLKMG